MDKYQLIGWLLCSEAGNQANIRLCEFLVNYIILLQERFIQSSKIISKQNVTHVEKSGKKIPRNKIKGRKRKVSALSET